MINEDTIVPKMIFIIPYRNRQEEQINFIFQMNKLLDCVNKTEYSFYFIHQCDDRDFCRGALKNIGFLMVKNKYPYCYKNITLIFNVLQMLRTTDRNNLNVLVRRKYIAICLSCVIPYYLPL